MRFHNSDKVSVHRARVLCHSERSEESIKASRTRRFFVAPLTVGLLRMTDSETFSVDCPAEHNAKNKRLSRMPPPR